jgi:hypothetical protein
LSELLAQYPSEATRESGRVTKGCAIGLIEQFLHSPGKQRRFVIPVTRGTLEIPEFPLQVHYGFVIDLSHYGNLLALDDGVRVEAPLSGLRGFAESFGN